MKIIKYVKKANNQYKIYLENDETINVYEDVILKHKLLYKKEIDNDLLKELSNDNLNEEIYNKCVKYISVRIRSIEEIKDYMKNKQISSELIEKTLDKLTKNKLLDDDKFTKAFVHDKLNFTTMGPFRIEQELKKHKIKNEIINKYLYEIDEETLDLKINKQINKLLKSTKKKTNLRNKIYTNLLSLGYSNEMILRNLNNYEIN